LADRGTARYSLQFLSEAFAALASKLPAKQAGKQAATLAGHVVELTAKNTSPTDGIALSYLSRTLVALAGRVPAEQAGTLAGRIVELAGKVTHPDSLLALSRAFAALAGRVPAEQAGKQAARLAGRIGELAARRTDESLRALVLALAFASIPSKRMETDTSRLVLRLASLSHRYGDDSIIVGALDRLLPLLGRDTILEALKSPGCAYHTRTAMVKHLGKRYNRSFAHVWELVDYLKDHAPELDLDSPLRLATTVR
jgi:hypothetical protein